MNDKKMVRALKKYKVAAFYCFTSLPEEIIEKLIRDLVWNASDKKVLGSILLAEEGVNGTICGHTDGVDYLLGIILNSILENDTLELKISWSDKQAFRRFKARRKAEIVTMGIKEVNPLETSGEYISPSSWNNCLDDPNTLVIDTRNNYEVAIGTFEGAINPQTDTFRQFPTWVDQNLKRLMEETNTSKIAMFCTGGIRCEKATAYLKQKGFKGVHHLHGGILSYLEKVPKVKSRWDGECFVFDRRVALDHNLSPGVYQLCHACGMPLAPKEREREDFVLGVQCLHCENLFTDQDRVRFSERQKQIELKADRQPKS